MPEQKDISVVTSKQFTVNIRDLLRGGLLAVISAVLTTIQTSLAANTFVMNWKAIGIVATTTLISYLLKNFFEPAKTIVEFKPPVEQPTTVTVTPGTEDKK